MPPARVRALDQDGLVGGQGDAAAAVPAGGRPLTPDGVIVACDIAVHGGMGGAGAGIGPIPAGAGEPLDIRGLSLIYFIR